MKLHHQNPPGWNVLNRPSFLYSFDVTFKTNALSTKTKHTQTNSIEFLIMIPYPPSFSLFFLRDLLSIIESLSPLENWSNSTVFNITQLANDAKARCPANNAILLSCRWAVNGFVAYRLTVFFQRFVDRFLIEQETTPNSRGRHIIIETILLSFSVLILNISWYHHHI